MMKNFKSWKSDLALVLPEIQRVALGKSQTKLLVISDRIAMGLPVGRQMAREVVNLYRPMKWSARMTAMVIKKFVDFGGVSLLKKGLPGEGLPEISWLGNQGDVGFLGCNPGHGLRCVLLSHGGQEPIRVTKLAIGGNLSPVRDEGAFLKKISKNFPGLPVYGGREEGGNWAAFWTAYLPGYGPRELIGSQVIGLLTGWLGDERVPLKDLDWLKALMSEAPSVVRSRLKELTVRKALVHGDFTPWNLRRNVNGLVAIDWEWAREDGIGGLDLGHGLVMQGVLVKNLRGSDLFDDVRLGVRSDEAIKYLEKCGWHDLNLWLAVSLLYASWQTEVNFEEELRTLEKIVE